MNRELQHSEQTRNTFVDWKTIIGQAFLQATHDSLTGLPNRALFHDQVRMALSESKRRGEILAILFIDLDKFKQTNDVLGHQVGDELLASASSRLLKVMRAEEMISRFGGDEFAVLIRRLKSPADAGVVAERLLKALDPLKITASIGISLAPSDGEDEETLLKNADTAMFRVKKRGGHGFEFFKNPVNNKKVIPLKKIKNNRPKQNMFSVDNDFDFQSIIQNCLKEKGYAPTSSFDIVSAVCLGKSPSQKSYSPRLF